MTQYAERSARRPERRRPEPRQPPARAGSRAGWIAAACVVLAGAAVANQVIAKRSERRHPPRGRFVTVDGVRLHYLDRGAGPAVVLIHGNGVTAEDFQLSGLLGRLAQGHRVIAFDRPGFGYSDRPRRRPWTARDQARILLRALTAIGVEAAVFVAHSWGTLVAVEAALAEPERARGLVLLSGYYWPTPRLDAPLLSGPAIPGLGDVMRFTVSPLLGWATTPLVFKQMFSPAKVAPRFKAGFPTSMSLRPWQLRATAADAAMMPLEAARTAARRKRITAPVLVISGDGDKIVSFADQSKRLAGELGVQLQVIEGAGHMIHHTAPHEVATAIEAFLDQIDRPPPTAPLPAATQPTG